ncbi:hypothetical protein [Kitasatospora sp. NPDC094016]|uniref:hypothetical protein n=1 Tax=Kitasatospora sp. NPDC094016 TaxID=3154986 RepID=UPI00332A1B27
MENDPGQLFLFLATVCLVIGAVGIANTTLVAVLERSGEIGPPAPPPTPAPAPAPNPPTPTNCTTSHPRLSRESAPPAGDGPAPTPDR